MARSSRGFSLIEVIVAMAIMALMVGAMAPLTLQQMNQKRIEATRARLGKLAAALEGDLAQGYFGYVGDMGALPPSLADLNTAAGKPAHVIDSTDRIGYGYNGPYAFNVSQNAGSEFVDSWDTAIQYVAGVAQVTSAGPDRVFGSADDLAVPAIPAAVQGSLVVRMLGVPNTGDPAVQLSNGDANVWVARSQNGVRQESALSGPVGGPGPWSLASLHLGYHAVRAAGAGGYAGAAQVRDVVRIGRGATVVTLTLVQP